MADACRVALEKLLAALPRCTGGIDGVACDRAASWATPCADVPASCATHADKEAPDGYASEERRDALADAIEAAEAALAEAEPVVTIGPHAGFGGMFRVCLPGIDHEWVDENTARIAAAVAEALGARVVRR